MIYGIEYILLKIIKSCLAYLFSNFDGDFEDNNIKYTITKKYIGLEEILYKIIEIK